MIKPGQKVYFELANCQKGWLSRNHPLLLSRNVHLTKFSPIYGTVLQVYTKDKRQWFLVEYGEEKLKTCFHFSDIDRYVRIIKEKEKKNGRRERKGSSL